MILEQIRKYAIKYKLSVVIGSATLFASCTKDKVVADTIKKNVHVMAREGNVYSGEEIFRGIFFKEGEVQSVLPVLDAKSYFDVTTTLTDEQLAQKADVVNDLINNINNIQPDFFDHFETEIKSDDYNRIDAALNDAANTIASASLVSEKYGEAYKAAYHVSEDTDFSQFDINTAEGRAELMNYLNTQVQAMVSGGGGNQCIAVAAVVVVAFLVWEAAMYVNVAAVATVAMVDVAVAVHIAKVKTRGAMLEGQSSEFYRDELISQLAVNIN